MTSLADAKRLIALSPEGLRILGAGVSRPCYAGRYNMAARLALEDATTDYTLGERRLIASFIEAEEDEAPREFMLRVRLTEPERARLATLAEAAGLSMSEHVRRAVFGT